MGKSQCKLNLNLIFRRFPGLKFKKISVKIKCFGAVENQEDSEEFPRMNESVTVTGTTPYFGYTFQEGKILRQ